MGNLFHEFQLPKVFSIAAIYAVVPWMPIIIAVTLFPLLFQNQVYATDTEPQLYGVIVSGKRPMTGASLENSVNEEIELG